MQTIVDLIIKWIVPFSCVTIVGILKAIYNRVKKHFDVMEKKEKANANGTMILLRCQLRQIYRQATNKKSISKQDYEERERIHAAYKRLDGNHFGDIMWEEIKKTKIEDL